MQFEQLIEDTVEYFLHNTAFTGIYIHIRIFFSLSSKLKFRFYE